MGLRASITDLTETLGSIHTLPGGIHAKATHISDGKVYGTAMWPGHPEPIRFWTGTLAWSSLVRGEVPKRAFGKPAPRLGEG